MSTLDNSKEARKLFESWNPSSQSKLQQYIQLFPEQFEKYADTKRAKIRGLNENDLFTFGKTLENQVMTKSMNEEATYSQLGPAPTLAFDFITALFGDSIIPYVASEQVIDEIRGLVYFENIIAQGVKRNVVKCVDGDTVEVAAEYANRGNVETGDILARAAGTPTKYPQGYAGEMVYGEQLDATGAVDGETKDFELSLTSAPIRKNYVKIVATVLNAAGTEQVVTAFDDGKGNIIGAGVVGSIDYETGVINLSYSLAPEADTHILANYATNFELGELPSITTTLDSKFIEAHVYGLQTDTSILSNYQMGKRFNFDMQQRAVQLLQEHILNEITTELLAKIFIAYQELGEIDTVFNTQIPVGVSQQAHFNSVDYTFNIVEQKMAARSGKGTLSVALAGPHACAFLDQNSKFEKIGEATAFATVYGVYKNSTIVIRCPQFAQFDKQNGSKTIFFLYKGTTPFDSSCVFAPYMPLVGVEDLPVQTALLNRRSAVASMAAVDVVLPAYIQKFVLVDSGNIPATRVLGVKSVDDEG